MMHLAAEQHTATIAPDDANAAADGEAAHMCLVPLILKEVSNTLPHAIWLDCVLKE